MTKAGIYIIIGVVGLFAACSKKEHQSNAEKGSITNEEIRDNQIKDKTFEKDISYTEIETYLLAQKTNISQRKMGDFVFAARAVTPEEKILQEHTSKVTTQEKLDSLLRDYNGLLYVDFSIDTDNFNHELLRYDLKSQAQYQERVRYFSFDFQQNIKLQACGQDFPCKLYHFERNFGVKSGLNFSMGFEIPETCSTNQLKLVVDDFIFDHGRVKINLLRQEFPEIKFNS